MSPAEAAKAWNVPPILTTAELASILNLTPGELIWFAQEWGGDSRVSAEQLRHYSYRWVRKRRGPPRLIEAPKQRLKAIQRFILRKILSGIPPHEAAHGFRTGRSVKTCASIHVGKEVVLKLDLKNFFPSIRKSRLAGLFTTAGYPEPVARLLAGLCANATPRRIIEQAPPSERRPLRVLHESPHLPQGAPTSPALANLAAYRLDCRLAGLAGSMEARYTRYADDIVFSGGAILARAASRFYIQVCAIAIEEGFQVNTRKTRIMKPSVRQFIAGLVVNQHLNVKRSEYDQLKAILYNCRRDGPAAQNRFRHADFSAHLQGRIAHVASIHPSRGAKLLRLFRGIEWGSQPALPEG